MAMCGHMVSLRLIFLPNIWGGWRMPCSLRPVDSSSAFQRPQYCGSRSHRLRTLRQIPWKDWIYEDIPWGLFIQDTCTYPNNGGKAHRTCSNNSHPTKWARCLLQKKYCRVRDNLQSDVDGSRLPQPGSSSVGARGPSTHNTFIYNILFLLNIYTCSRVQQKASRRAMQVSPNHSYYHYC